jgi:hypothetical protein
MHDLRNTTLRRLALDGHCTPRVLSRVVGALTAHPALEELSVSGSGLGDDGVSLLCDALAAGKLAPALVSLCLARNGCGEQSARSRLSGVFFFFFFFFFFFLKFRNMLQHPLKLVDFLSPYTPSTKTSLHIMYSVFPFVLAVSCEPGAC